MNPMRNQRFFQKNKTLQIHAGDNRNFLSVVYASLFGSINKFSWLLFS
jgi:hypothetical protein